MTVEEFSRTSNSIHKNYERLVEEAKKEYEERLKTLLQDRDAQIIDLSVTMRFYEKVAERMKPLT